MTLINLQRACRRCQGLLEFLGSERDRRRKVFPHNTLGSEPQKFNHHTSSSNQQTNKGHNSRQKHNGHSNPIPPRAIPLSPAGNFAARPHGHIGRQHQLAGPAVSVQPAQAHHHNIITPSWRRRISDASRGCQSLAC